MPRLLTSSNPENRIIVNESWFSETANGFGMSIQIKEKIHDERSPYQHIEVFETESFGRLLALDGIIMLTSRDNFIYHEMLTHPVLFSHSNPKNVVIVGGGDCGVLKEVLKHDHIETVLQVELDERVTRVSEQFFPELCESNSDPRATFLYHDAIQWMKDAKNNSADIIILDTTDPAGQAARLFTKTFYNDCYRVLRDSGIMMVQSESPLLDLMLLRDMRKAMDEATFDDIVTILFPQCTYPSGWWSASMARKGQKLNGYRETAARKKTFTTRYYNADIHVASQILPNFVCEALDADR